LARRREDASGSGTARLLPGPDVVATPLRALFPTAVPIGQHGYIHSSRQPIRSVLSFGVFGRRDEPFGVSAPGALLPSLPNLHSFPLCSKREKRIPFFFSSLPPLCKNPGIDPHSVLQFPLATSFLATNSFRRNTYRRTPRFAAFWPKLSTSNPFRCNTYRLRACNPFIGNTYKNTRRGPCASHDPIESVREGGYTEGPLPKADLTTTTEACEAKASLYD
jgi:hypothetical protein